MHRRYICIWISIRICVCICICIGIAIVCRTGWWLHFMHLLVCSLWIYWTRFYRSNKCCILQVVQVLANVSLKTALINEPGVAGCWSSELWPLVATCKLQAASWERARYLCAGAPCQRESVWGAPFCEWAAISLIPDKSEPRSPGFSAKSRQTNCGNQSGVVSQSGRTINIELSRLAGGLNKKFMQIAA